MAILKINIHAQSEAALLLHVAVPDAASFRALREAVEDAGFMVSHSSAVPNLFFKSAGDIKVLPSIAGFSRHVSGVPVVLFNKEGNETGRHASFEAYIAAKPSSL